MKGSTFFQMWMFLLLGTITVVARAQVPYSKVLRGNSRRDDLYRKDENIMVTSAGGAINSPRYPHAYPRNLLLSWKLVSPRGTRIHLEFDGHFGLEEAENGMCRYDFVEVEDQSETSTLILGRWCGQKPPSSLNSKTNKLKVTFKSDDYFVAKPGFKVYYSLLYNSQLPASNNNWEAVTRPMAEFGTRNKPAAFTDEVPLSVEELDQRIAAFDTVEQMLKSLNPHTWREDLTSIYTQTPSRYKSKAYRLASRRTSDLNHMQLEAKLYTCTPRNYSANLREELRITHTLFFPRCLLVKRCGGNCGCGTGGWNRGCQCQASQSSLKLHEVLMYVPEPIPNQINRNPHVSWVIDYVALAHHEACQCACPLQPSPQPPQLPPQPPQPQQPQPPHPLPQFRNC